MGLRITQVDAFTDTPFAGNPAAVCLLPAARDEGWMQSVAREMNLSETAFLVKHDDGFNLRWFTPAIEVALCGHATLASAHVLWEEGHLPPARQARFHTKSGPSPGIVPASGSSSISRPRGTSRPRRRPASPKRSA